MEQAVEKVEETVVRILKWGDNASGHLIKHRNVLGYGSKSAQEAQRMLPELQAMAQELLGKMELVRIGRWERYSDAKFYIGQGKMIVTRGDGTLITLINKTSNKWFQQAIIIK